MKIIFHGANASAFEAGFAALLQGTHEIACVSDSLAGAGEQAAFHDAEVIVGIALTAKHPRPERLRRRCHPSRRGCHRSRYRRSIRMRRRGGPSFLRG